MEYQESKRHETQLFPLIDTPASILQLMFSWLFPKDISSVSLTYTLFRHSATQCTIDILSDGVLRSLKSDQLIFLAGIWLFSSLRVRVSKRIVSIDKIANRLHKLKTLRVDPHDVVNVESVNHILPGVPFESLLSLSDVCLDNTNIHSIGQLVHCHGLKKLSLKHCAFLYDISALENFPLLEDLNISSLRQVFNFECLKQLSELVILYASDCNIVNANVFMNNRKLTSLDLSDCKNLDCITALSDLPRLQFLNLDNTSAVVLPSLQAIQNLNLHNSAIADISVLTGSCSLTSIDLSWCVNINAVSLLSLNDCDNLTSLDISRTSIESIEPLCEIINLSKLICNSCTVTRYLSFG